MTSNCFYPQKQIASLVPTLASPPAIRHCCHTVWSFHNSQSQQEKPHFISKMDFSSNPALKISLHHFSMIISSTSLCNLSLYLFHTYESTQMANYASDCTELLCIIRDESKCLSWEKVRSDSIRHVDFWAWGGQLVHPLSLYIMLHHRHFMRHSHHVCKQGIRRWGEVQGRRWHYAARSTGDKLEAAEGVMGASREATRGSSAFGQGFSEHEKGEVKDTSFSLCKSS